MSAAPQIPPGLDISKAPRVWHVNGAGMRVKGISRAWLLQKIAAHERATAEAERMSVSEAAKRAKSEADWRDYERRYRRAVLAEIVPVAPVLRCAAGETHALVERIALAHGFTSADLFGPRRAPALVAARHEAIRTLHAMKPHLTTVQIGRLFNRDHSSIVYVLNPGMKRKRK